MQTTHADGKRECWAYIGRLGVYPNNKEVIADILLASAVSNSEPQQQEVNRPEDSTVGNDKWQQIVIIFRMFSFNMDREEEVMDDEEQEDEDAAQLETDTTPEAEQDIEQKPHIKGEHLEIFGIGETAVKFEKIDGTEIKAEEREKPFQCNICLRSFSMKRLLLMHRTKTHNIRIKPEKDANSSLECHCGKRFEKESILKRHQILIHDMRFPDDKEMATLTKCSYCNKLFTTDLHLTLHKLDKHDGTEPDTEGMGHSCEFCEKHFTDYRKFLAHKIRIHHNKLRHEGRMFECEVCNKVFRRTDSLTDHRNVVHLGKKRRPRPATKKAIPLNIVCEICGCSFSKRSYLVEHIALKHSDSPLKNPCPYCPKSFNREHLLEFHVNRIHLNQKPYQCEICGKGCYSSRSLRAHVNLCKMEGEKRIACEHCSKTFTSQHNLTLHIQAVHSEPALVCPCGKVVRWMSSVAKHKRRCRLNVAALNEQPTVEPEEKEASNSNIFGTEEVIQVVLQRSEDGEKNMQYIVELNTSNAEALQAAVNEQGTQIDENHQIHGPVSTEVTIDPNITGITDGDTENVQIVFEEQVVETQGEVTEGHIATSTEEEQAVYYVMYK